ncbi:MAG TPA: hypothetical protein VLY63_01550, partial [Anaerolineae bacterium]|nr:hypothetical protein [Anaerolineae bacterium]
WMLIKRGDELDLTRLVELARANHFILLAQRIVRELNSIAASPKGEQLLQLLLQERVTVWERLEGRVLYGYAYAPGPAFRVVRRLLLYRRSPKQKGWLGPIRYIEYVWGARGLRSLPGRALNFLRRSWRLPGRA